MGVNNGVGRGIMVCIMSGWVTVLGFANLWGCMYVYIMIIEQGDGKERRQEMRRDAKRGRNDSERMRNVSTPR